MNNKNLKFIRPVFPAVFAIVVALLFLIAPVGTAHSQRITASTPNYQPNVSLNTNVTWNNFYNGWTPLEYNNGTANKTLPTNLNPNLANPITLNPTDIISNGTLQGEKVLGNNWTTIFGTTPITGGSVQSVSTAPHNGVPSIQMTQNTSEATGYWQGFRSGTFGLASYPSNNAQDIYINYIAELSGPALTGVSAQMNLWNSSGVDGNVPNTTIYPGQTIFSSEPLTAYQGASFEINRSSDFQMEYDLNLPATTSTSYSLDIYGLSITTYPLTLGSTSINNKTQQQNTMINPQLTSFNPNFQWSEIANSGYTVGMSQHLSQAMNYSAIKTPISSGNYVEEVGYSGNFHLPQVPDLSYSESNLTLGMNVPGSQIQVLDINGLSYLNDVQNKTNGTVSLINSVDPNSQTSFLEYVNYTYSQWNSISSPPGAFSIYGIEYYYWIAIGAVAGLIGLGAGAHRANVKAQQLRGIRPPRGR